MNPFGNAFSSSTYILHKRQEEKLQICEQKHPNVKNLKIRLTYDRALLEIYHLSKTAEYEKYFYSLRGLTPIATSPKVLGAWMDKIGNYIRIALLDEKKENEELISGKVLNLWLEKPSNSWYNISSLKDVKTNKLEILENKNLSKIVFHFAALEHECSLSITVPNENSPQEASEISPTDSSSTFVKYSNMYHANKVFFNELQLNDLERDYDIEKMGDYIPDRENSHRCFMISYQDIQSVVNNSYLMKNANRAKKFF